MRAVVLVTSAVLLAACSTTEGTPPEPDAAETPDATADVNMADAPHASDATPESSAPDATDASLVSDADSGPPPEWPSPVLSKIGAAGKVLLQGMIVTPDKAFAGEVLVDGNTITCVAKTCAGTSGASVASVVDTKGLVFPGLIDTHNHILFDVFDETDWTPKKAYTWHDDWTSPSNEPRYAALVDAKQWLNGESTSYAPSTYGSLGCEMLKYGEIKALLAGTTSVLGAAGTAKKCFGSLARSVDTRYDGNLTGTDSIQVATLFPTASTAQPVCDKIVASPPTLDAYFIHVAEGTDYARALSLEIDKFGSITTPTDCLYAAQTTVVHGTAFTVKEFAKLAANGMSLSWSPRSNVFLYGSGTDLTKTTNIPLALSKGVNVALSPDWSIGGSQNLLDELPFANRVDDNEWGDVITPQMLAKMVTINAAKALHRDASIGSLEVGKRADIMVLGGDATKPYDALLAGKARDVMMTMVDGVILAGDPALVSIAPATPGCETVDVCKKKKFICVATTTTTDKMDQTLSDITTALTTGLSDFDALASPVTGYTFSPITPLVRCP